MDSAVPHAELDALRTALPERDQLIEALQFEFAQLKRLLFGRRSEHLEKPVDPNQLPLWPEVPEDAPMVSPVTFKTVTGDRPRTHPNAARYRRICRARSWCCRCRWNSEAGRHAAYRQSHLGRPSTHCNGAVFHIAKTDCAQIVPSHRHRVASGVRFWAH
jgi:hypothetical protein